MKSDREGTAKDDCRPRQYHKNFKREEKLDRIETDIIAAEALKIITEAYEVVF